MRFLIDTNVFLEVILEQDRAQEARAFLVTGEENEFFMSDYSLHSIGLLLFRQARPDVFAEFVQDMVLDGGVIVTGVVAEDVDAVVDAARNFDLDFDDAYQYAVAEKYHLPIVSFDSDFDRTALGRKTPAEVVGAGGGSNF